MKPGIPWSIKGIETETREAAKAAARRSGLTLGQWLNTMIQSEAEAAFDPRPLRKSSSRKGGKGKAKNKKHGKLDNRLDELAQRINDLSERNQHTAIDRYVADFEDNNNRALQGLIERIESNEGENRSSFEAVNNRLNAIDDKLSAPAAANETSAEYQALESAVRNIVEHIETSDKRHREALSGLQERMSDVTKRAEQSQTVAVNQSLPAIAALEARIAELSHQFDGNARQDHVKETRNYIDERLTNIGEQLDAMRHSTDSLTKRAEVSAADVAKREVREMEGRVAGLLADARTMLVDSASGSDDDFAGLRNELESLNQRLDDIKVDAASERDVEQLKLTVENLANATPIEPDFQPINALEQRLADLTHRLDDKAPSDHLESQFAELEQRIVGLDAQLADALAAKDDANARALDQHIAAIDERLSSTEQQIGQLATLEQSITQLYGSLEQNQSHAEQAAEAAAARVADQLRAEMPQTANDAGPSPELRALEDGLDALRNNAHAAERHNQETLEAVHETLEQIITKLTVLEEREVTPQPVPVPQGVMDTSFPPTTDTMPGVADASVPGLNPPEQPLLDPQTDNDWQQAVQSHLSEPAVMAPGIDVPQTADPQFGTLPPQEADVAPAFVPGQDAVPGIAVENVPGIETQDQNGQVLEAPASDNPFAMFGGAGQEIPNETDPTAPVVEPQAPDLDQTGPSDTAPEPELDYIAQARLASQSAAGQSTGGSGLGASLLKGKLPGMSKNDDGSGEVDGTKPKKSLFSLPFLNKSKPANENQPTEAGVDPSAPASKEKDGGRRRLIIAGLVLLVAAGAFAFNKFSKKSSTTAHVDQPAVTQPATPPAKVPGTKKPDTAKKADTSIEKTSERPPVQRVTMNRNVTTPSLPPAVATQVGIPAPDNLSPNANQRAGRTQTTPQNGPLAAPVDPITTASLPPNTNNVNSPLSINRPASTKPPVEPNEDNANNTTLLPPAETGTLELRTAAANGDSSAQFVIASRYAQGKDVKRDFNKAAAWYQKAASAGLAPAQYRLGTLFERGNGVPRDMNAARLWYERAAEQGNVKAMHNLAVIYANARFGEPDFKKARVWFEKAAAFGLKDSQYNLAVIFERGLAEGRDAKSAYLWYSLAAARGDNDARVKARNLKESLTAAERKDVDKKFSSWRPKRPSPTGNFVAIKDPKWKVATRGRAPVSAPPQNLTGKQLILAVQTRLSKLGFDVGKPDGVMGSRTANAVRLFQLQNGLPVNGMVSKELLQRLSARS